MLYLHIDTTTTITDAVSTQQHNNNYHTDADNFYTNLLLSEHSILRLLNYDRTM